ncbi:MAG: 5-(carboxyamino)imidazole ribonucleotide synthase [Salibacteraceae bacterium]|nr:5-(carboxyamino)imidazole ribonucleotide synthase [Salibacteraceae bacterium]|tara:strand:+ start:12541 stop:13683 length:1143 start_codon:yes stop_codon:yes gene_type:complete
MNFYSKDFKLGMLGGGQLGKMFIQEAVNYNVQVCVLDPDKNAPCRLIAHEFEQGDFKDYQTVLNFGKDKDVLTIEIEHVNTDALKQLEKNGLKVFPQPRVLELIKDKGLQKQFYSENGIPTAPYVLVNSRAELSDHVQDFPFMQKARTGGYDGKGVHLLKSIADTEKAFDSPSVLEKFVDFEKELSVIVARNESGEVVTYPIVELEFNPVANLVEYLKCPAKVSKEIEGAAEMLAKKVAEKLDIVGLLAVEFFLTKSGELLVNEVAPRTHNSGHQTIEGNVTSQFEQHMRAVLNLPLGDTSILQPSVMLNVLGDPSYTGEAKYENLEKVMAMPQVHIHLYGKHLTKPYRKMGHVTITHHDIDQAYNKAREVKALLKVVSC